jgi:hypothetical protein
MKIYKTRDLAEAAKQENYSKGDMVVKVDGGFTIMSVREYINWLLKQ